MTSVEDEEENGVVDEVIVEIIKHVLPATYPTDNDDDEINKTDGGEEESRDYVVEKILEKKLDSHHRALYLVKWEGFPSSANTWEPIQNLAMCAKKMEEFELGGAVKLAKRLRNDNQINGSSTSSQKGKLNALQNKKYTPRPTKYREYKIMDVIGMTQFEDERYYLVSVADSTQKTFIRASVADRVFPNKVINFYIKNLRWKQKNHPGEYLARDNED